MNKKVCLVTGGFDPLHRGHIEYFKSAKNIADYLIVGVNSDCWLQRKKTLAFMPIDERIAIIENLTVVDEVISFNDDDNSACAAISICLEKYKEIIFANGGDRNKENIPEMNEEGVQFLFEIGGNFKRNSSSSILDEWVDFAQKNKG